MADSIVYWLIDYYLAATVLLLLVAAAARLIRQPARRMAIAWGACVGLTVLAVLRAAGLAEIRVGEPSGPRHRRNPHCASAQDSLIHESLPIVVGTAQSPSDLSPEGVGGPIRTFGPEDRLNRRRKRRLSRGVRSQVLPGINLAIRVSPRINRFKSKFRIHVRAPTRRRTHRSNRQTRLRICFPALT